MSRQTEKEREHTPKTIIEKPVVSFVVSVIKLRSNCNRTYNTQLVVFNTQSKRSVWYLWAYIAYNCGRARSALLCLSFGLIISNVFIFLFIIMINCPGFSFIHCLAYSLDRAENFFLHSYIYLCYTYWFIWDGYISIYTHS